MAFAMDPKDPVDIATDLEHPMDVFTDFTNTKVISIDTVVTTDPKELSVIAMNHFLLLFHTSNKE